MQGIAHRDLKPDNLIYDKESGCLGSGTRVLKLTDFGLSKMGASKSCTMKEVCGTPDYVAPEIVKNLLNRRRTTYYNYMCDEWSIGVIMFGILGGFPPWTAESDNDIFKQVVNGEYSFKDPVWKTISSSAKDVIKRLMTTDPSRRLSAADLLEHPWVANPSVAPEKGFHKGQRDNFRRNRCKQIFKRGVRRMIAMNNLVHLLTDGRYRVNPSTASRPTTSREKLQLKTYKSSAFSE